MSDKNNKQQYKYKAGLFIITCIALLIFCLLWLNYFNVLPVMTIIAKFNNSGPMSAGIQTYYKGITIGKVKKLEFAKDFKSTLIYIEVQNKKVCIPDNSTVLVKIEGISGQKYLDIVPPYNASKTCVVNNGVIKGKSIFGVSDLQYYLQELVTTGRLEKIVDNIEKTFNNSGPVMQNLEQITGVLKDEKQNIKRIVSGSSDVVSNLKDLTGGLNNSSSNKKVRKKVEESVDNINQASKNIKDITDEINDKNIVENFNSTLTTANTTICDINQFIEDMKAAGFDEETISSIVSNVDVTSSNVKCMSVGISKMLGERALLLKLMFGRPGKYFENCQEICKPKMRKCKKCPKECQKQKNNK